MCAHRPLPGNAGYHAVHFFSDLAAHSGDVADFLTDGLVAQQPVVVIATREQRRALLQQMTRRRSGAPWGDGSMVLLDAHETLRQICDGGSPKKGRVQQMLAQAVRLAGAAEAHAAVRVYGEIVDVLCREGRTRDAITLEELWHDITATMPMSLMCGYHTSSISGAERALVRGLHTHVTEV